MDVRTCAVCASLMVPVCADECVWWCARCGTKSAMDCEDYPEEYLTEFSRRAWEDEQK